MKQTAASLSSANFDVPTDDRPIRWIGYLIILLTVGVFGVWSYLAPIDSSSLAVGSVTVKSHRKTVQHLDGGIISRLLVKDGDVVSAGDDLVLLDEVQLKSQVEMLRGQYITQKALYDRLLAERQQKDHLDFASFTQEKLDRSIARGLAKYNFNFMPFTLDTQDSRVQEAMATQRHSFMVRKSSHEGELNVLKQRIQQLNSKIEGLQAQRASKQKLLAAYTEEIKDLRELLAQGFTERQRLRDQERNQTITNGEIAGLTSEIATTEMQRGETQLEILLNERKFQEEIAKQIEEVNAQLFDIGERLQAAQDKLTRTVIKAPVSGVIFNLASHTEGGVVTPGNPILDIVPEDEDLIIRAQVSPADIDKIHPDSRCEVRFSSFDNKTTPTMEGKVSEISADSFNDEKTGTQYYMANIELSAESREKLGDLKLIPGMPAEILINIGSRTLFEYLMQPITDAFARSFIED